MTDIPLSWFYRLVTLKWDHEVKIAEFSVQYGSDTLDYANVTARPKLDKGLFWNDIVFPSSTNGQIKISGINKRDAQAIFDSIINGIQDFHRQELTPYCSLIPDSYQAFKKSFNGKYVRHSTIERWEKKSGEIYQKLNNEFALESLANNHRKRVEKYLSLCSKAHSFRDVQNQKFITSELQKYNDYFDTVENNPLTESQRMSCVVNEDNNLVLAGAGSGKTSVIIAKTGYLIQSGLAKPHEILILAYGRKASRETNERIKEKLPQIEGIKTSTFHKLGFGVCQASCRLN